MSKKKGKINYEGEVIKVLPNVNFSVKLGNGHVVTAYASGRMRKAKVKVLLGDRVEVEMGIYDNTKGIVVHRHSKMPVANAPPVVEGEDGTDSERKS